MGGFQLVLALVRLAQTSVRLMERGQWFNEGQRVLILAEMEARQRAIFKASKNREKIRNMTDEELDKLRASYIRP